MSVQEQIAQIAMGLTEEDAQVILKVIQRFQTQPIASEAQSVHRESAFIRLEQLRNDVKGFLPKDFNISQNLTKALEMKYSSIS